MLAQAHPDPRPRRLVQRAYRTEEPRCLPTWRTVATTAGAMLLCGLCGLLIALAGAW